MRWIQGLMWGAFAAFVAIALAVDGHPDLFTPKRLPGGKHALWGVWVLFLAYSFYSSTRENLFRTIGVLSRLWWGRQIGLDLYIGASLSLGLIYLHEGSALVMLAWLLPVLAFVNLATLLYFAIHYDSIVARFLGP